MSIYQTDQIIYLYMCAYVSIYTYMYIYMHVTIINENREHEFEREQGVYEHVWRENREGGNDIISKIKERNKKD